MSQTSGIDIFDDSELYLNVSGTDEQVERNCNKFAGVFLVPTDIFEKDLAGRSLSDNLISRLSMSYSVSREVILRKLLDLKRISPETYSEKSSEYTQDYFRAKINKKDSKGGGNYYNTQAAYKGKKYTELVFTSYYSNKINITQLSKYMGMKIPSALTFAAKNGWGAL